MLEDVFAIATVKRDMGEQTTNPPKILAPVTPFPSFHWCQLQSSIKVLLQVLFTGMLGDFAAPIKHTGVAEA